MYMYLLVIYNGYKLFLYKETFYNNHIKTVNTLKVSKLLKSSIESNYSFITLIIKL